ncbi:molybdenum ABC transporter permease [Rubrolithibacter danxiaensis]|uniref:molybdenum ABC transporter permease n=1 Tax=Rubrolithibacter danxiaensis TaxID=3390805 RepID=UPI003BF80853
MIGGQVMTIGIMFLLAGFILKYIINRRKFNRRSITGMELFHSYEQALFIRSMEGIVIFIARVLIALGSLYAAFRFADF